MELQRLVCRLWRIRLKLLIITSSLYIVTNFFILGLFDVLPLKFDYVNAVKGDKPEKVLIFLQDDYKELDLDGVKPLDEE